MFSIARQLLRPLIGAAVAFHLTAPSAHATADEALLSGSDPLLFATLTRDQPAGGEGIYNNLGYRFGLGHDGGPAERVGTFQSLSPILYWDDNVNNGLAQDSLLISGLVFDVPPDMVARSGLVYGFEAGIGQRWIVGPGLTLQPSANVSLTNTAAWKDPAIAAAVSLCGVQTEETMRWTTLCLQQSHAQGGTSRTVDQTDLFVGQEYFLGQTQDGPAHLLGISGRRIFLPEGSRDVFGAKLTSAWPGFGATEVTAEAGTKLEDVQARTRYLSVMLTKLVAERPTEFTVFADQREGSFFLGEPIVERNFGASVARPISDRLKVEIAARRTNSSADAYDDTGLSLRFLMPSFARFQ